MLDPDIVVRQDMGSGTVVEVRGAENVARRARAAARSGAVARPALVNGAAGWISFVDGKLFAIAGLTVQNGRIARMEILVDPERLARVDLAAFERDDSGEGGNR